MIWNSISFCKWRKHQPPVCISLTKDKRMLDSKIEVQPMAHRVTVFRTILLWHISSLPSRNFLHCFSLGREKQIQKLLKVMTERIHTKLEGYHVSLMNNDMRFLFCQLMMFNDFIVFVFFLISDFVFVYSTLYV